MVLTKSLPRRITGLSLGAPGVTLVLAEVIQAVINSDVRAIESFQSLLVHTALFVVGCLLIAAAYLTLNQEAP